MKKNSYVGNGKLLLESVVGGYCLHIDGKVVAVGSMDILSQVGSILGYVFSITTKESSFLCWRDEEKDETYCRECEECEVRYRKIFLKNGGAWYQWSNYDSLVFLGDRVCQFVPIFAYGSEEEKTLFYFDRGDLTELKCKSYLIAEPPASVRKSVFAVNVARIEGDKTFIMSIEQVDNFDYPKDVVYATELVESKKVHYQ